MKTMLIALVLMVTSIGTVNAQSFSPPNFLQNMLERQRVRQEARYEVLFGFDRHTCICQRFSAQRECRKENRVWDFAGSFGAQKELTEALQGSIRDLTEANRLAGLDRERLMDRLAENKQDRKRFEKELNGFRAERSGLLEQLRNNRAERQLQNAIARDEREKQMLELAKARKGREGLMVQLGIVKEDSRRLFARQRGQFAPLRNLVERLTWLVISIMVFLVAVSALFLLVMYLWKKAKDKVGL